MSMFSFLKSDKVSESDTADGDKSPPSKSTLGERFRQSLAATRARFGKQLATLLAPGRAVDDELFDELETILLTCDVGVEATQHLVNATREQVKRARVADAVGVRDALRNELLKLLSPLEGPLDVRTAKPFVILLARQLANSPSSWWMQGFRWCWPPAIPSALRPNNS